MKQITYLNNTSYLCPAGMSACDFVVVFIGVFCLV
jgi:hypothetical protein